MPHSAGTVFDPEVYYVVSKPGTYFLQVATYVDPDTGETTTGPYNVEVRVARPGMESKPVGAKQIVYLDFDGAQFDFSDWRWLADEDRIVKPFAPLADALGGWGLKKGDLNALTDELIKRVTGKLYTFVARNGDNGDYRRTGRPGDFGIDIRNSRDDRDRYGKDPLVSRIVFGKTADPVLNGMVGGSGFIDVGNFDQADQSFVSTDYINDLLAAFPRAKPNSKAMLIDFVAEYLSNVGCHEFGHMAGCFHTQYTVENEFTEPVNLMDRNHEVTLGPDLVFGTRDDITQEFGVDDYDPNEAYVGRDDTLNTVAFGLSTGTALEQQQNGQPHGGSNSSIGHASGAWSLLEAGVQGDLFAGAVEGARN